MRENDYKRKVWKKARYVGTPAAMCGCFRRGKTGSNADDNGTRGLAGQLNREFLFAILYNAIHCSLSI